MEHNSVKTFKVYCLPLSTSKHLAMCLRVNNYAKIYNFAAEFMPSLPEKYLNKHGNYAYIKGEGLVEREIRADDAQLALKDAVANHQSNLSKGLKHIKNISKYPNVVKAINYQIIKDGEHYGVMLPKFIFREVFLPLSVSRWKELQVHLDNLIAGKTHKMPITYNLRDNSVSISIKAPQPKFKKTDEMKTWIGVDLGVNNTAVLTAIEVPNIIAVRKIKDVKNLTTEMVNGKILEVQIIKGFAQKEKIKRIGMLENKRRYLRKKVGDRRSRIKNHMNHKVSAAIVKMAEKYPNSIVIFEKGLANLKKGKYSAWSPADAKTKTEYKLKAKGIRTFDVYPGYTSKICHRCGAIGTRTTGTVHFKCPSCGLGVGSNPTSTIGQYNADVNASINIALRGLYVLLGHKARTVQGLNVQPNESARENNTSVHSEADNGSKKFRKSERLPAKAMSLGINETKAEMQVGVSSESREQAMVKSDQVDCVPENNSITQLCKSSSYKEKDNFAASREYDRKPEDGDVQYQGMLCDK